MPTSRSASRASAQTREQILADLKDDHKRVRKAYREFQKLDREADPDACEAIVLEVLDDLTVHAALEEELLYPAAREALKEADPIDEAEVEHEMLHVLIDQLREMAPDEPLYAARFTVLCEYVLHHVKEEEGEMFPALEKARGVEWEALAEDMSERRAELMPEEGDEDEDEEGEMSASDEGPRASASGTDEADTEDDDEEVAGGTAESDDDEELEPGRARAGGPPGGEGSARGPRSPGRGG